MGKKSPCLSCKHKNVYEPLTKSFVCNFSGIECKNFEMYKPNSQTNADKIRAMTDEGLAEAVKNPCDIGYYMPREWCVSRNCGYQCSLDWLKQEASDD